MLSEDIFYWKWNSNSKSLENLWYLNWNHWRPHNIGNTPPATTQNFISDDASYNTAITLCDIIWHTTFSKVRIPSFAIFRLWKEVALILLKATSEMIRNQQRKSGRHETRIRYFLSQHSCHWAILSAYMNGLNKHCIIAYSILLFYQLHIYIFCMWYRSLNAERNFWVGNDSKQN